MAVPWTPVCGSTRSPAPGMPVRGSAGEEVPVWRCGVHDDDRGRHLTVWMAIFPQEEVQRIDETRTSGNGQMAVHKRVVKLNKVTDEVGRAKPWSGWSNTSVKHSQDPDAFVMEKTLGRSKLETIGGRTYTTAQRIYSSPCTRIPPSTSNRCRAPHAICASIPCNMYRGSRGDPGTWHRHESGENNLSQLWQAGEQHQ